MNWEEECRLLRCENRDLRQEIARLKRMLDHGVEWRTLSGFSRYEISENGDVRRHGRLLKQTRSRAGHMKVTLYSDAGDQWRAGVHHLVARAFIGDPPRDKPFACHKNGRAWENHKDNLYWGDRADNVADAVRHASLDRGKAVENGNRKNQPVETAEQI